MITITTEEKERVYHLLVHNKRLTTSILRQNGFTEGKINALVRENTLRKTGRGVYDLYSAGPLYLYSVRELTRGNTEEAVLCYEYYYRDSPIAPSANFAMFMRCILKEDYANVEKYLDGFMRPPEDRVQNNDYNFYLYLLSFITELPEKYRTRVHALQYSDITIPQNRQDRSLEPLRIAAFYNRNFQRGLELLNAKGDETISDVVTRHLICQANEKSQILNCRARTLIKNAEYEQLVDLLEHEAENHPLRLTLQAKLLIAKDIVDMRRTGLPSVPNMEETNDFYRLIQIRDYDRALENNETFASYRKLPANKNSLGLLLSAAVATREELICKPKSRKKPVPATPPQPEKTPLPEMISAFMVGENEVGFELLKAIINIKGLHEYHYLLKGLLKICIEERDTAFTKPLIVLSELSRKTFRMDTQSLIDDFDYFLGEKHFASARICLSLISESARRQHSDIDDTELARILETLGKRLSKRKKRSKKHTNKPTQK